MLVIHLSPQDALSLTLEGKNIIAYPYPYIIFISLYDDHKNTPLLILKESL